MRHLRSREGSIYGQLAWLLLVAFAVATVFFLVLNRTGDYLIREFFMNTDYQEREDSKRIERLQAYITEQGIAATDSARLTEWIHGQSVVAVRIYKDGYLIYDSNYPEEDFGEEAPDGHHPWEELHTIVFSDGKADVLLYGFYDYQFFSLTLIGELILSFLLLLGIVMLGIRKTIRYILTLSQEISVLEGGDLDHPVTVSGNDELSRLAEGLDAMRLSFRAQTETEKQLTSANQRMITEMSHDLRTPLTSIMLYTEILLKGKYRDEAQMMEYIGRIDQKARRLKQLSDHLFEYSLIAGEAQIHLEEPARFQTVFYDMLSEAAAYLEQQNFRIVMEFVWKERYIRVNADHISRIFDNLTSNIVKYADLSDPVRIRSVYTEQSAGIAIRNKKAVRTETTESTLIGLHNIKSMMAKMGGQAIVEQTDSEFELLLEFPSPQCCTGHEA